MKKIMVVLSALLFLTSCAHLQGDVQKIYELHIYANCYQTDCDIDQVIMITVTADVKKEQAAEATQKTALDLTGIPRPFKVT